MSKILIVSITSVLLLLSAVLYNKEGATSLLEENVEALTYAEETIQSNCYPIPNSYCLVFLRTYSQEVVCITLNNEVQNPYKYI